MRLRLYHPFWTHIPALAVLAVVIWQTIRQLPLPACAPVHFGANGVPDRYDSPWEMVGFTIGFSILFIALSVLLDELWARQEHRKTFNWMSLFDEATIGFLGAVAIDYLRMLSHGETILHFPWSLIAWVTGGAIAAAVVLELVRPYVLCDGQVEPEDTSALETEIARKTESGETWSYYENQNPIWMSFVCILTAGVLIFGAIITWREALWVSIIQILIAFAILPLYGGLRVSVTPERVTVRLGVMGIPILRLKSVDITEVEVHEFAPLHDFGGYGIRFGCDMKAYFFRGTRGVRVTTVSGKKYLIGSDHPDSLAVAIRASTWA